MYVCKHTIKLHMTLPVLEICGPLGMEGAMSVVLGEVLPGDSVVRVAVSMTVVGVVPNGAV